MELKELTDRTLELFGVTTPEQLGPLLLNDPPKMVHRSTYAQYEKRGRELVKKINTGTLTGTLSDKDARSLYEYSMNVKELGRDFNAYSEKELDDVRRAEEKWRKKTGYGF